MTTKPAEVTLQSIQEAAARIRADIVRTPCLYSHTLSDHCGAELFLKFENLQFTSSFKERGALNKLLLLSEEEQSKGVVAMSAGNHAQALAYHATRLGLKSTIVMPANTPFTKITNTEKLGAQVVLAGERLADSAEHARQLSQQYGYTFVHPYDDEDVIAGQGTVALEVIEQCPELQVLLVPVGGGGLISGVAVAAKALKPKLQVIGIQAEHYPFMAHLLKPGEVSLPERLQDSLADGISVKQPGTLTALYAQRHVDDVLLVSEAAIEEAINLLLELEKTVVEGAGAVGLAALLSNEERFAGQNVCALLTGGNIDQRVLADTIVRGLVRTGRLTRLRVTTRDLPGQLAQITAVIAQSGGNIVEVHHHRVFSPTSITSPHVELVVATRDARHASQIVTALENVGYAVSVERPG